MSFFNITQSWISWIFQHPQQMSLSLLQTICESVEDHKSLWNSSGDNIALWKQHVYSYPLLPFFLLTIYPCEELSIIPEQLGFFGEWYCQKPFGIPWEPHQWHLPPPHAHYWIQQPKAGRQDFPFQNLSHPQYTIHTHVSTNLVLGIILTNLFNVDIAFSNL